jgi:hypothetical protein
MFLGRRKPLAWFLHSSSTWRANLNKCLVQPRLEHLHGKSSQNTLPMANDAGIHQAEKKQKNRSEDIFVP